MKRIVYSLFIIFGVIMLLALPGCRPKAITVHKEFLSALKAMDFEAAYELISPEAKGNISKVDFAVRYALMINELGITLIDVRTDDEYLELKHEQGAPTATATYSMHYAMEDDELSYQYTMALTRVGESWYVDWTPSLVVPDMTWGDTLRVVRLPAKRGEIFSADGEILAKNEQAVTVYVNKSKLEQGDQGALVSKLTRILGVSEGEVSKKLSRAGDICPIVSMLPGEFNSELSSALLELPGVGIDRRAFGAIRTYPRGRTLAHTLGYTGSITAEELAAYEMKYPGQYTADSHVGKAGLELAYEKELRGVDGREYYIAGENGEKRFTLYTIPARDGLDLRLTVDLGLQERVEEVMIYSLSSVQTGAVIVLNHETGAVKALSSFPGYDPNLFVRGISEELWQQFQQDKSLPLYNRITQGLYPPGSILKPFTAAAFLESGAIAPETAFKGKIEEDRWTPERPDWVYPPIKRVEIRYRPTPLNLQNAMITSDNIFFAYAALETGQESFLSYMDGLGMNESMPFDLPLAVPHIHREGTEFNIKFLADSGYGQGEVLTTPMQIAAMYTALYGGDIMTPYLVDRLYRTEGADYLIEDETIPTPYKAGALQKSTLDAIKPSLEKVMTDGTGHTLGMRNRSLAGKTGTAQVGNREVSWLAVYTLDRDEPLLALVVIDTEGSVVKFDIVREILKYKLGGG